MTCITELAGGSTRAATVTPAATFAGPGVLFRATDVFRPLRREVGTQPRRALAGRRFVSRVEWGADERLRGDTREVGRTDPTRQPVRTLTLHHTATPNADPDPAATVRSLLRCHAVERGLGDLSYAFLIDADGRIYEGRHGSGDPANHAGHCAGGPAEDLGIALLGDFTDAVPAPAARRSLLYLLTGLVAWHRLDPFTGVRCADPPYAGPRLVDDLTEVRRDVAHLLGLLAAPGDLLVRR